MQMACCLSTTFRAGELDSAPHPRRAPQVIAAMTVGKDVSSLFTDVVNCIQVSCCSEPWAG